MGKSASSANPTAMVPMPTTPNRPPVYRPIERLATGTATTTANGQAVIRIPASAGLRPKESSNKKSSATKASV